MDTGTVHDIIQRVVKDSIGNAYPFIADPNIIGNIKLTKNIKPVNSGVRLVLFFKGKVTRLVPECSEITIVVHPIEVIAAAFKSLFRKLNGLWQIADQ